MDLAGWAAVRRLGRGAAARGFDTRIAMSENYHATFPYGNIVNKRKRFRMSDPTLSSIATVEDVVRLI
jgi:hypothetical protein